MASKTLPPALALGDAEVIFRHLIWLPAAGLSITAPPPAFETFAEEIAGQEDLPIFKDLPQVVPYALDEDAGVDDLCRMLEGVEGYLICLETPKRKWFSDGSPRINWGETWTEWRFVKGSAPAEFVTTALAYTADVIKEDGRRHPRIDSVEEA